MSCSAHSSPAPQGRFEHVCAPHQALRVRPSASFESAPLEESNNAVLQRSATPKKRYLIVVAAVRILKGGGLPSSLPRNTPLTCTAQPQNAIGPLQLIPPGIQNRDPRENSTASLGRCPLCRLNEPPRAQGCQHQRQHGAVHDRPVCGSSSEFARTFPAPRTRCPARVGKQFLRRLRQGVCTLMTARSNCHMLALSHSEPVTSPSSSFLPSRPCTSIW